jgi:hypothetical protein
MLSGSGRIRTSFSSTTTCRRGRSGVSENDGADASPRRFFREDGCRFWRVEGSSLLWRKLRRGCGTRVSLDAGLDGAGSVTRLKGMNRDPGGLSCIKCLWLVLSVAATAAVFTGCQTAAERLEPEAVKRIKPGVSTRQEVLKEFGVPRETLSAEGRTLLNYERDYPGWESRYGPTHPANITCLSVLFGPDDRVLRVHHSSHEVDVYAGAGSVSAGSRVSAKLVERIRLNVTTQQEAIAILGEPTMESLTLNGGLVLSWGYWDANFLGAQRFRMLRLFVDDTGMVVGLKTVDDY